MKRSLLLALPLLVSCNSQYPSAAEASAACEKWRAEGGTYDLGLDRDSPMINPPESLKWQWEEMSIRTCDLDPAGLYLGTDSGIKPGQRVTIDELRSAATPRIVKRFRY